MNANADANTTIRSALKFGMTNKVSKPTPPITLATINSLRSFFGEINNNPGKKEAHKTANKLPYSMNTSPNEKPVNQYISLVTSYGQPLKKYRGFDL